MRLIRGGDAGKLSVAHLVKFIGGCKRKSGDLRLQPPSATFHNSLVCFLDLTAEDKGPLLFPSQASRATSKPIYCPRKKSIAGFLQTAATSQRQRRHRRERWFEEKDEHRGVFLASGTLPLTTYDIKYGASAAKPAKVKGSSILDGEMSA